MSSIFLIHQSSGIGGATQTLVNLVGGLHDRGVTATVACPRGPAQAALRSAGAAIFTPDRPIRQFSHLSGYEKFSLSPRFWADVAFQHRDLQYWHQVVAAHHPDVVHLNAITLAPLAVAAKRAGCKVSMMIQETGVRGMLGLRTAWLRWLLSHRVDLVAFISRYDREWYAPGTAAVEVVPNWVDERAFGKLIPRDEARALLGMRQGARVVLFVGGVAELKGTVVLLEALRQLQEVEGVELLMAGPRRMVDPRRLRFIQRALRSCRRLAGSDYDSRVARLLSDRGLRRRIRYVGEVDNMARLYCAADVVVFPAVKPHQARPAIEAGVAGVPVIASDFVNYGEFLQHDRNALLVPAGDSRALAQAIQKVLTDGELARRLACANAAHVSRVHDRKANCDRMVDGILSLLSPGRTAPCGVGCTA